MKREKLSKIVFVDELDMKLQLHFLWIASFVEQ